MSEKEQKIKFPIDWSYRIIVDKAKTDCCDKIIELLKEYGIDSKPEKKSKSSGGKYQAYKILVIFESQEIMNTLSSKLSAIDGVKFLL